MNGVLLGLDFGERRIGVALCDPDQQLASGLTTLDRRARPDYLGALEVIIRREKVTGIVLGYPLRTDGREQPGAKTEAVDRFAQELKERFQLPVHLEDESFTSTLAAESLRHRGKKKRKSTQQKRPDWNREKAEIDRVAACFILQDYLDRENPA